MNCQSSTYEVESCCRIVSALLMKWLRLNFSDVFWDENYWILFSEFDELEGVILYGLSICRQQKLF